MRFLHAADLHLGSALPGFRARSPGDVPEDVDAPLAAFDNMLDLARREEVDFLVIAGDLYDGEWKDFRLGLDVADRLRRLGKPCFVLRGNHDAASVIPRSLPLPQNVREFGSSHCGTLDLPELGVALHGQSFRDRAVTEDLSLGYCPPTPQMFNIGVLHTSAEDRGVHDTYAPCSVASLATRGYDYWALGHIHQRREVLPAPWIVFPGNTQGRHIREAGQKGCSIVTVRDGRVAEVRHHDLDVVRWARVEVDMSGATVHDIGHRLEGALARAFDTAGRARALAARIELVGETEDSARLRDNETALIENAVEIAVNLGGQLWLERLRVRTTPPGGGAAPPGNLDELRRRFFEALPKAEAELVVDMRRLRGDLPDPARAEAELPLDAAALAEFAEEAWAMVAQRLGAGDEE